MGSLGSFAEVLQHVARGALHPVVAQVVPFEDAQRAQELLELGEVFGKVVLVQHASA
jgi:NADPH:quinone reductase-like Zn-dependent oxidoreductase